MFEDDVVEIDDEDVHELDNDLNIDNPEPKNEDDPKPKDDDDDDYGARVQKRIAKEVSKRKQLEDAIAIERERNNSLVERLNQIESRISQSDKESKNNEINDRISQLKRQKIELMETGEFDKVADIDDEIIDLKVQSRQGQKKEATKPRQDEVQPRQSQSDQAKMPEAQAAWLNENDWFYNPLKADKAKKANELYQSLMNEGYDPDEPDLYAELDKRLTKRQAAPPPAGVDRGNAATGNSQAKFTAADKAKMMNWGLNPNDPDQRKEYLKNKVGA